MRVPKKNLSTEVLNIRWWVMLLASVKNAKVKRTGYSTGDVCMTGEKFRDGVRGAMGDVTDRKCSEEYEA